MTDIIPFRPKQPSPKGDAGEDGSSATPGKGQAQRLIPYTLVEAAANILNDIVATRRGQVLSKEDWAKIRRANNFIDGARSVAREQGLPHDENQD